MKSVHFDISTGEEIPAHKVEAGATGFISWRRIAEVLRAAEELRPDETAVSIQVDERGLSFRVR